MSRTLEELNEPISERERTMALALDAGCVGTWSWTPPPDGSVHGGQLLWDARMHRLFRSDPTEFRGTYEDFAKLVDPNDLPLVDSAVARSISTGEPFEYSYRLRDGRRIRARAQGLLDSGKNVYRLIGVCIPEYEPRCKADCPYVHRSAF